MGVGDLSDVSTPPPLRAHLSQLLRVLDLFEEDAVLLHAGRAKGVACRTYRNDQVVERKLEILHIIISHRNTPQTTSDMQASGFKVRQKGFEVR